MQEEALYDGFYCSATNLEDEAELITTPFRGLFLLLSVKDGILKCYPGSPAALRVDIYGQLLADRLPEQGNM